MSEKRVEREAALKNTSIRPCSCASEFQDGRYGKAQRVHNRGGGKANVKWTCTVCGSKK